MTEFPDEVIVLFDGPTAFDVSVLGADGRSIVDGVTAVTVAYRMNEIATLTLEGFDRDAQPDADELAELRRVYELDLEDESIPPLSHRRPNHWAVRAFALVEQPV